MSAPALDSLVSIKGSIPYRMLIKLVDDEERDERLRRGASNTHQALDWRGERGGLNGSKEDEVCGAPPHAPVNSGS